MANASSFFSCNWFILKDKLNFTMVIAWVDQTGMGGADTIFDEKLSPGRLTKTGSNSDKFCKVVSKPVQVFRTVVI